MKSKSALPVKEDELLEEGMEEEKEEEKELSCEDDDFSDAISRLIDDEDEQSVLFGISEQNNVSNNLRFGVASKLERIGYAMRMKKSDNALNKSNQKLPLGKNPANRRGVKMSC